MTKSKNAEQVRTKAVLRTYNSELGMADGRSVRLIYAKDAPNNEDEAVEFYKNMAGKDEIAVQLAVGSDYREALRILYRTAEECRLLVVIPAIVLPSEVEQVRDIARDARESLTADGLAQGKMQVGISIETPSAAILADLLAPMADFFVLDSAALKHSLGLGANETMPESVKRCVKMACAAAKREGFEVKVKSEK